MAVVAGESEGGVVAGEGVGTGIVIWMVLMVGAGALRVGGGVVTGVNLVVAGGVVVGKCPHRHGLSLLTVVFREWHTVGGGGGGSGTS